MEHNGKYMMENNYQYMLLLFEFCQAEQIPFIYASSAATYGPGKNKLSRRVTGSVSAERLRAAPSCCSIRCCASAGTLPSRRSSASVIERLHPRDGT